MFSNLLHIPVTLVRPLYERSSFHRSVIEELDDQELREAYSICRSITRNHAKTFYMATRFLPNQKQRGIFAIYALCRYIDDMVDEAEDLIRKHELSQDEISVHLGKWKSQLQDTYEGYRHDNPILLALADVLKHYHISIDLPFTLMEGVAMDLVKNRYQSFKELYEYAYKVASIVGLMTLEIFGYSDSEAPDYAVDLGIAMQLTNILRDLGEDLSKDRIYLPREDLDQFQVRERDLIAHRMTENFVNLMKYQICRARHYYSQAEKGIPMLSKDSRLPVGLALTNYSRILDKIEENSYQVFSRRAYLSKSEKLMMLPRVLQKTRFSRSAGE
ncbi:MAG: squalene/phytoene synthase family protein [Balneolaceae bacterium]|nr:squalene/phytoene synthase family protein [Balneolaceae bacterium]